MKNFVTAAAFAASANALVGRGNSCCFHLKASGGATGSVGQLDDGQNRIYGGLSEAQFCISSNGAITDANGRGCIVTDATTQFQCDEGAAPFTGFSINSEGQLSYRGDQDFVACKTGQNGGLNIYTTASDAVTGCSDITLTADSCSGSGGSGSSPVPVPSSTPARPESSPASSPPGTPGSPGVPGTPGTPGSPGSPGVPGTPGTPGSPGSPGVPGTPGTPGSPGSPSSPGTPCSPGYPGSSSVPGSPGTPGTPGTPSTPGSPGVPGTSGSPGSPGTPVVPGAQPSGTQPSGASCPTNLGGNYEYPHLIIPIDSSSPDTAHGTSYNGIVSSSISTIFNFDVPSSDSGKTCSLIFLFPKKEDLETSSYSFSGDGKVEFASLESVATESTTYSNAPGVKEDVGAITISPGNSYLVSTFECPAGQAVSYEMKNAGSTELNFFEDYNPSPLGLYITVC